jgi:peptide deformylase
MTKGKKSEIEILQTGDPVLRQVSSVIPKDKVKSSEIKKIITDLKNTIKSQKDAAAISAVQIGKLVRLFVISKRVFENGEEKLNNTKVKDDLIFINPKIIKTSKTKQTLEEGCLSVRYVYGQVSRPEKVTIEAYDENGIKFSRGFSGLLSTIVQHENDHLDGILFTDKANDIQKISKEEYDDMLKNL